LNLQPSAERVPLKSNYITNFDFLNQYLPDTYEKEFERYGNRTISSFLRMVGAEMPSNSDLIKWAEQGSLHTKYTSNVLQELQEMLLLLLRLHSVPAFTAVKLTIAIQSRSDSYDYFG
jgi:hypothetical protein